MKTTEIKTTIPRSLKEVWVWKEKVYEETKDKNFKQLKKYYADSLEKAAKMLNAKLVRLPNGSYLLVKNS